MMQIIATNDEGKRVYYKVNTIPFSNEELERQLLLYYNKPDCNRCRDAVLQSGFARLLMEVEDGLVSYETFQLFPILAGLYDINIKEN